MTAYKTECMSVKMSGWSVKQVYQKTEIVPAGRKHAVQNVTHETDKVVQCRTTVQEKSLDVTYHA